MAVKKRKQQNTFNPYAAGKRVYSNGTHRPTSGQVDPTGYIKREAKKRQQNKAGVVDVKPNSRVNTNRAINMPFGVGRLDESGYHRSGLAKAALDRQDRNDRTPGQVDRPSPAGPAIGSGAGDVAAFAQPQAIKINKNGELDLPYSNDMAWDLLDVKTNFNQQLLELQQAAQQQAMEYARQKRDASFDYEDLNRDTLNSAAARGMAYSSGYGHDVADNARRYNNFLGDLEGQNTMFNQNIASQRAAIENALNEYIRMAALQRAQELEDQAGDLGYGQDTSEPSYEDPTPSRGTKEDKKPSKKNNSHKVNMDNFPRIDRLLDRYNGDKSKIVRELVGKGNAGQLGPNQLRAIGFGKKFIKRHTPRPVGRA